MSSKITAIVFGVIFSILLIIEGVYSLHQSWHIEQLEEKVILMDAQSTYLMAVASREINDQTDLQNLTKRAGDLEFQNISLNEKVNAVIAGSDNVTNAQMLEFSKELDAFLDDQDSRLTTVEQRLHIHEKM